MNTMTSILGRALWVAAGSGFLFAQPSPSPLFSETFELPEAAAFSKWVGGAVKEEKYEIADREGGGKCFSISFVPVDGKFWYFSLPVDQIVDKEKKVVISCEVKFASGGSAKPEVTLGTAYDGYKDAAFQEVKVSGWVSTHGAPAAPESWQTLKSPPYNRILQMKENGKDEPFVKMKRILVMIKGLAQGERFTLWVDNVSVAAVSPEEERDYEKKNRIAFTPREYPIQSGRFYYGVWATPHSGDYRYWPYADLIPKKERALCNLEAMLKCNFDTAFTETTQLDGSNLEDILAQVDSVKRFGISSIAKTYLTPYYDRKRTLDQCAASIEKIVPRLKANDGIVAYYLIDEPEPNEETMKWWLWGKSKIGAIDPSRPVTGLMDQISKVRYFGYTEHTLAMDAYPFEIPRSNSYLDSHAGGNPLAIENYLSAADESGAQSAWMMLWAAGHLWSRSFYARMPTAAEMRLMSYATLANGGRGLFYFVLRGILPVDSGKQEQLFGIFNEMYQAQNPFSRELIRLGETMPVFGPLLVHAAWQRNARPAIEASTIEAVSTNKKALGCGLYSGKDYELLIVYNRDAGKDQKGILTLKPEQLKGREIFDLGDFAEASAPGGRLSVTLAPGDGRFFLLASKEVYARVVRECFNRKYQSAKRRLDFLKPEAAAYGVQPGKDDAESEALLSKDPRAAFEKKKRAETELGSRLRENPDYQTTRKLLDEAGALYSSFNERYRMHLAAHPGTFQIPGDPERKRLTIQLLKLTDTWVLLRNGLYAGRGRELTSMTVSLKSALSFLEERSRNGDFKGVENAEVDALFSQAQSCLGLAERSLLK
ncbi:MAG: hypothetical protein JNM63_01165 [Spirochaetia bacterium]|nr:hypothetical protein [Spirochaetia bacterium]